MNAMADGMAHISFTGGSMFLPVRNPYDRQLLLEHVGERVRAKGQVQVLMGDRLWMVHRNRGPGAAHCARCGLAAPTGYCRGCDGACYCVACALENDGELVRPLYAPERRAG
jgi:hypothetical protein